MIDQMSRPRFVKKYSPDQGGNDFLGLRAVNTNLMSLCLPGINNVTTHTLADANVILQTGWQ